MNSLPEQFRQASKANDAHSITNMRLMGFLNMYLYQYYIDLYRYDGQDHSVEFRSSDFLSCLYGQ